ncbi:MAG: hypothetical protein HY791_08130 [Deltaproteobacteria bacterium]|nr:hypothetical protein [Deltaproteobacteria bacterium]
MVRSVPLITFLGFSYSLWGCHSSVVISGVASESDTLVVASELDGHHSVSLSRGRHEFEIEEGSRIAAFAIPAGVYFDLAGQPLGLESARGAISTDSLLEGACGTCQIERPRGLQVLLPGDRCPIPSELRIANGLISEGELVPSAEAEALAGLVRLDLEGQCLCSEQSDPKEITLETLAPLEDAATVTDYALAPDGSVAVLTSVQLLLVEPNGRRWTYSTDATRHAGPVFLPNTSPPAFAFLTESGLERVSAGDLAPSLIQPEADGGWLAANDQWIVATDYRAGPTLPEMRVFACGRDPGAGCVLHRFDRACIGRPASISSIGDEFWLVSDTGRIGRGSPERGWSCPLDLGSTVLVGLISDELPPGMTSVTCSESAEGAEVVVFDLSGAASRLVTTASAPLRKCGSAPFVEADSVIAPLSRGAVVYSSTSRSASVVEDFERHGRALAGAKQRDGLWALATPDSSIWVETATVTRLVYGRDQPDPATPVIAWHRGDLVAYAPSGLALPTRTTPPPPPLAGLDRGELLVRIVTSPFRTFVLTRLENETFVRGADPDTGELGPRESIGDRVVHRAVLASGRLVFLSEGSMWFWHPGDSPRQIYSGANLTDLSVAQDVFWATGANVLLRGAFVGSELQLDVFELGSDDSDPALLPTEPMEGIGIFAHCGSRARVALRQRGVRLSVTQIYWKAFEVTIGPSPCGDTRPSGLSLCSEESPSAVGGTVQMFLSRNVAVRDNGFVHASKQVFLSPLRPMADGVASEDGRALAISASFGRVGLIQEAAK